MSEATDLLAAYIAAETAVLSFGSYQWGDRRMTRADLGEIRKGRAEWQRKVDREAEQAAGQTSRYAVADFRE
jgi:hypothetical protein